MAIDFTYYSQDGDDYGQEIIRQRIEGMRQEQEEANRERGVTGGVTSQFVANLLSPIGNTIDAFGNFIEFLPFTPEGMFKDFPQPKNPEGVAQTVAALTGRIMGETALFLGLSAATGGVGGLLGGVAKGVGAAAKGSRIAEIARGSKLLNETRQAITTAGNIDEALALTKNVNTLYDAIKAGPAVIGATKAVGRMGVMRNLTDNMVRSLATTTPTRALVGFFGRHPDDPMLVEYAYNNLPQPIRNPFFDYVADKIGDSEFLSRLAQAGEEAGLGMVADAVWASGRMIKASRRLNTVAQQLEGYKPSTGDIWEVAAATASKNQALNIPNPLVEHWDSPLTPEGKRKVAELASIAVNNPLDWFESPAIRVQKFMAAVDPILHKELPLVSKVISDKDTGRLIRKLSFDLNDTTFLENYKKGAPLTHEQYRALQAYNETLELTKILGKSSAQRFLTGMGYDQTPTSLTAGTALSPLGALSEKQFKDTMQVLSYLTRDVRARTERIVLAGRATAGRTLRSARRDVRLRDQQNLRLNFAGMPIEDVARYIAMGKNDMVLPIMERATQPGMKDFLQYFFIHGLMSTVPSVASDWISTVGHFAKTTLDESVVSAMKWMGKGELDAIPVRASLRAFQETVHDPFTTIRRMSGQVPQAFAKRNPLREGYLTGRDFLESGFMDRMPSPLKLGLRPVIRFYDWLNDQRPDELFKAIGIKKVFLEKAYKEGMEQGLKGDALENFTRRMMANPSESWIPDAKKWGEFLSFSGEPTGWAATMTGVVHKWPLLRTIMPFVNIVQKINNATIGSLPVIGMMNKQTRVDWAAGGTRRAMVAAKMGTAGLVMSAAWNLMDQGLVTGYGPENPTQRAQWLMEKEPYAIRIGDRWVSYARVEPFASWLAIVADIGETLRETDQRTADTLTSLGVHVLLNNIKRRTALQNVASLMQVFESPDRAVELLGTWASSAVMPPAIRPVTRLIDPHYKDASGFLQQIIANTPGLSRTIPPMRDMFGNPVLRDESWWKVPNALFMPTPVSPVRQDPVLDELNRLKIYQGRIADAIGGPEEPAIITRGDVDYGYQLNQEEKQQMFDYIQKGDRGYPGLYSSLKNYMDTPGYKDLADETREKGIKRVIRAVRAHARDYVLRNTNSMDTLPESRRALNEMATPVRIGGM